ncbi:hypothetical protein JQ612_27770 [Bradyrhizobium manausense]|uniref:hypothetical protein n=1 Tax=Bradyrhizobium manausense TaxID=989370 RepID=UPI001BA59EC0|nr:hypothetical protein [Bradyrhizobium manausense]MBR0725078.1 hypothetical protein [Bradyrhizobium manausense]MBR0837011.1 hypothetical protein [Bradyrhizobium manausense]
MRLKLTCAVLAALAVGLAGCDWREETGFVEVKKSFASLAVGDTLVLNETMLDFGTRSSLVIQQPTGTAGLQVRRGETSRKLCEFAVRKNRMVTVTLAAANGGLRCSVQS